MEFQIVNAAEATEIKMSGRLTYDDHLKFNDIKMVAGGCASGKIVFDLSGLEFIDSAGLGMLVIFEEAARAANAGVVISGAHGIVRKLMDLVKFSEVIRIID